MPTPLVRTGILQRTNPRAGSVPRIEPVLSPTYVLPTFIGIEVCMYAKQKLYEAVSSLTGTGSIQERLTYAGVPLVILQTPANEVPADIREELTEIVKALTVKPLSDRTGYPPRDLSDDDAKKIADRILSLFVHVMGGL